jgi:phosphate transport system permease protein
MSSLAIAIVVFGLALIGWLSARMRAATFRTPGRARFTALPVHYGYFVGICALVPPLVFLAVWSLTAPALVTDAVLATPAAAALPPPGFERASILSEARELGAGRSYGAFHDLSARLAPAYATAQARYDWIATAVA